MSHAYTPNGASFPATITVSDDGDAATGSLFATPDEQNADRSEYLKNIVTVTGVPRIASVADVTSLKAINVATVATGDLRLIVGSTYDGLYRYDSGSALAESLPWVVAPGAGSGRWIHSLYSTIATASGIATLNASSRAAQLPPNGTATVATILGTSGSTTSTSMTDLGGSASASCQQNDILLITASAIVAASGAGGSNVRIAVVEGAGAPSQVALLNTAINEVISSASLRSVVGSYTVGSTNAVYIKFQGASGTGGQTTAISNGSINVIVVRP